MCGLAGIVPTSKIDIPKFNALVNASRDRGMHATGWCAWSSPKDYCYRKESGYTLEIPNTEDLQNTKFLMAHVRKATKGSWGDNACNHPHQVDNLIMIHNGTTDALDMAKKENVEVAADNDSLALLTLIQESAKTMPIDEALKLVLGEMKYQDYYSIVLLDADLGDVYFVRESMRPMVWLCSDEGLVFASKKEYFERLYRSVQFFGWDLMSEPKDTKTKMIYRINVEEKQIIQLGEIPTKSYVNVYSGCGYNNDDDDVNPLQGWMD